MSESKPKRGRGRPRVVPSEASTSLSFILPVSMFDRLCREASAHRVSLAQAVRVHLARSLRGTTSTSA